MNPVKKKRQNEKRNIYHLVCVSVGFSNLITPSVALRIFIRSSIILLGFYFVIGPVLGGLLNKYLQKIKINEYATIQKSFKFITR